MCFSTGASFSSAVVLSTIGIATIKKVHSSSQLPYACIPLIFSSLQLSEGFIWVSLTNSTNTTLYNIGLYSFLIVSQVVWPTWVPASVLIYEGKGKSQIKHKVLLGIGVFLSIYAAFCLCYYPVGASIIEHHISYNNNFPDRFSNLVSVVYLIATIVPPFLSSNKWIQRLGLVILLSFIISYFCYTEFLTSVWCFFASLISGLVYYIIWKSNSLVTELK